MCARRSRGTILESTLLGGGSVADIFISYAPADQAIAAPLAATIEARGWTVFWDRRIPAGWRFDQYIEKQLESARCVIVLWSKAALGSDWVIEEAARGRERRILVPARIEDMPPPLGFSRIHAADLIGWRGEAGHSGVAQLLHDIEGLLGPPPQRKATGTSGVAKAAAGASPPAAAAPASAPRPRGRLWLEGAGAAIAVLALAAWSAVDKVSMTERPIQDNTAMVGGGPAPMVKPPPAFTPASSARVGQQFRDCADNCPEMVALPGGTFFMGSPESEDRRRSEERPQREVRIKPFAIGKYEVTFDQWDACVAAGGCERYRYHRYRPDDAGWGRGRRPVINVSWDDAKAYVAWLAKATGKPYRLPTEAEWEYAARAGTTTPFALPSPKGSSNIGGEGLANCMGCGSQWDNKSTAPVGSFPANAWSLHDMHGNAYEWVEDIWHDNYQGAPVDGSAWIDVEGKNSSRDRVSRDSCWYQFPKTLRSAVRHRRDRDDRSDAQGFRVARTLS